MTGRVMQVKDTTEAAAAPSGLRVIEVTDKWALGEFERCVVVVWSGQPDDETMSRRAIEIQDLVKRHPGHCALLEIVEPTAKPPSQETRRVAMEVFRKIGNDLSAIGFVLEGGEMRSALIRAVITGMLFFVKQPQPSKVFKRLEDMLDWVRPHLKPDRETFDTDIRAAFEHLRGLMHAHGPTASR
jgi:hypothetical protein